MSLTLTVDGDRWRQHLLDFAGRTPGLVPVAKGNGYGFGLGRLATEAADLGVATIAVGTAGEVAAVRDRFDGEIVVWESMAINLYLARRFGGPLAAANLAEEAGVLRWSFWAMTECEKDALAILFHRFILPTEERKPALADAAEKALAARYAILENELDGRDYLLGERFTVADLNVASVLAWAAGAPKLREEHPRVADWLKRCLGRPAQKKVMEMARAERTR